MSHLFQLGQVAYGPGVASGLSECGPNSAEKAEQQIKRMLNRHSSGDWGEVSEEERMRNDEAVQTGGELVSVYILWPPGSYKLWIVTDAQRICTTVLAPGEHQKFVTKK